MKRFWLQVQFFFFGNVDKILDNFNTINRKLDKAAEMHRARAEEALRVQAAALHAQQVAEANAAKATTAANNIRQLLGE